MLRVFAECLPLCTNSQHRNDELRLDRSARARYSYGSMAGHSHWAKIKRAKGANDSKRGKVWSKIARKIIIGAKSGGRDPKDNLSLRYINQEGKACNMPKDTIANAIKKGTGELGA